MLEMPEIKIDFNLFFPSERICQTYYEILKEHNLISPKDPVSEKKPKRSLEIDHFIC